MVKPRKVSDWKNEVVRTPAKAKAAKPHKPLEVQMTLFSATELQRAREARKQ